jgi:transcriptional regulator with XRE-family HTH domain
MMNGPPVMSARFRLRELLERRGISQSDFAKQAGLSFATVNRLCTNATGQVSLDTLDRVATALGVEIGDIIEQDAKRKRRKRVRSQRYVWWRYGDFRSAGDQAIAECKKEHGGKDVGEPDVRHTEKGSETTLLAASGEWWRDYMGVHGKAWTGPITEEQALDLIDPKPPLGG